MEVHKIQVRDAFESVYQETLARKFTDRKVNRDQS